MPINDEEKSKENPTPRGPRRVGVRPRCALATEVTSSLLFSLFFRSFQFSLLVLLLLPFGVFSINSNKPLPAAFAPLCLPLTYYCIHLDSQFVALALALIAE